MAVVICGSLAFDTIMHFEGRFKEQILPEQLHILNVSFLVPQLQRDGAVATDVTLDITGASDQLDETRAALGSNFIIAIVLIYLLIVVNFQSWKDPVVIISALPAALAGIVWILFVTGTPLSVPALTGAIMCMGMATANSILVVSFARERLTETGNAIQAALEAGYTRFRPVMMTTAATVLGHFPLVLVSGAGAQARNSIGIMLVAGMLLGTLFTLFVVPAMYLFIGTDHHQKKFKQQ